ALDRAPADVVAVEGAVPGDAGDRRVGALLRIRHTVAQRAHAQHPTTGGDHVPALHPGAGVEDPGVVGFGYVPGIDGVADARLVRVALGGHHHAQRRAWVPLRLHAVEPALDAGFDQVREIGLQAHQDRLRFRIAEAHVELDHLRHAVGADHQPGIEEAGERRAI